MPSLVFDTCCCCIELKTGCFILGYLNLIGSLINTVRTVMDLMAGVALEAETDEIKQEAGKYVVVFSATMLPLIILFLVFTIVLLNGLHQNKPGHVKAFLIYATVGSILSLIPFIILFAALHDASLLIVAIFSLLLNVYFLLVIRSQYYRMLDPTNGACVYNANE